MLSDLSQSQGTHAPWIHSCVASGAVPFVATKSGTVGGGWERVRVMFGGDRVTVWGDEKWCHTTL